MKQVPLTFKPKTKPLKQSILISSLMAFEFRAVYIRLSFGIGMPRTVLLRLKLFP